MVIDFDALDESEELKLLWADGTRAETRKLKDRRGASRYCPICRQQHAA